MNHKKIVKHLSKKMQAWMATIDNEGLRQYIADNVICTGGAIVNLLDGKKPNDYDIYFKTYEAAEACAKYYMTKTEFAKIEIDETFKAEGRVFLFISSDGIAAEEDMDETFIDDQEAYAEEVQEFAAKVDKKKDKEKSPYRPVFISSNAITLSDGIQLVMRFTGDVGQIHENYDFVHCTCSFDFKTQELTLPVKALECIHNKELIYRGSKYPVCSMIRTRKFLQRGWHINAGQYAKIAFQISELNLKDFSVFKDQLMGVDSGYFAAFIDSLDESKDGEIDFTYVSEALEKIFD